MSTTTTVVQLLLNGLMIGMVYVLVAAGLSIIFGVMDVLNIAHGELFALGAYLGFAVITQVGPSGFWLALVLVPLAIALLGMLLEYTTIRKIYGRGHLSQILLTFGLLLILYDLKWIIWGKGSKLYTVPASIDSTIAILGFSYSMYNYMMIVLGGGLALGTWLLLNHTKFGLVIRAGSQDRDMVRYLSIDIDRYYTLVFGFGAALAAFGGVVLGGYQNVGLEMGNSIIIPAFVIVVLGGLGSFRGAVYGGLGVGLIQSVTSTYVPALQGYLIFAIMILVLLFRPQGLFGEPAWEQPTASHQGAMLTKKVGPVLEDHWRRHYTVGLLGLLVLVPFGIDIVYTKYVVSLLNDILIWALFALSLDIALGYTGLISLGHAMFFGLGAYAAMLVFLHLSPSVFVAIGLALLITAIVAWVVGQISIRVSGVYFVMITLAFAELLHSAVFKFDFTGGSNGLFGAEPLYGIAGVGVRFDEIIVGIEPFTVAGDSLFYYFLLGIVVLSYFTARRIMDSPFGSVLEAVRESENRTKFMGYGIQSYKRQSFVISAIFAGLAGALFTVHQGYAAPALLHWINSGDVIIMTVLGGAGTLYGPMIGAAVFVGFENVVSTIIPWWRLLLGVIFVLVVIFFPNGIVSMVDRLLEGYTGDRRSVGVPDDVEVEN